MSYVIKEGDTLPPFQARLTDASKAPIDLTGCEVNLVIIAKGASPIVDAPAEILSAEDGSIRYEWNEGETDTPGRYQVEVELTYPDGRRMTVPASGYGSIQIMQRLRVKQP